MINLIVAYDFGIIDKSVVLDFAKEKNVIFPDLYVEFISMHNGGQFVENNFIFFDEADNYIESNIGFCSYGNIVGNENIEDCQDYDIYGYDNLITFGLDGGGDYIAFDYRKDPLTNNPPVVFMYHDEYITDHNNQIKMKVIQVANNFEDFVKMLHD
ncbi:SMI1/KNR4 family protein [Acinetobacter sp. ESL0695]|uniref:SMI1/KNR4 family protein n=1 Tax=Acinetobacter sp. ESL0695 TaxID=2983215 RepID=UPI0023EF9C23|nr:SMI1/KNR4 family protein [Acinetobacter sp. ESL0695]WEV49351.1 SMI1/KNR4 family protein [Acinetobacter sp. ESL0695]